ncbi:MAG TPA: flagellar biosynthesis protein FliQ [Limnobacter sp.]|uniref:flagellar biosynthesis protein FliQ n=1 Tax=Limnobacter sp. TaxID=2003368 RepID=UPI002ED84FBA
MNSQTVLNLGQDALQVMLMVSGPLLIVALILGLLISILQAATQINEMTLSFIPKILGIFATMMLLGPWMLATLVDYTQRLISSIPNVIG